MILTLFLIQKRPRRYSRPLRPSNVSRLRAFRSTKTQRRGKAKGLATVAQTSRWRSTNSGMRDDRFAGRFRNGATGSQRGGLSSVVCAKMSRLLSAATRNALRQMPRFRRGRCDVGGQQGPLNPLLPHSTTGMRVAHQRGRSADLPLRSWIRSWRNSSSKLLSRWTLVISCSSITRKLYARGGFASNSDRLMLRHRLWVRIE